MKKKIGITLAVVVLLVCVISVAALAGCKEKVTAENAQAATEANWAEIDNKSATTTVNINNAEIALGVNGDSKAVSITASAQVTLNRTWENGVLTIDVTAKPTAIGLSVDITGDGKDDLGSAIKTLLTKTVNFDKLTGLEFKAQAFYNYGSEEKTIGVRNMTVSGLASAIPALAAADDNITDAAWAIRFLNSDSGKYESEVSYNLADLNGLIEGNAVVSGVLSKLFNEGYTLDLTAIIEDLLVNQTMLDFSDATSAAYEDGVYRNTVKATDNLSFITEIWNQISNKAAISGMLQDVVLEDIKIGDGTFDIPVTGILKELLGKSDFSNLVPDILAKVNGNMTVEGTIENDIFTSLKATLSNPTISLTSANIEYLIENVLNPILTAAGVNNPLVGTVIDAVEGGSASVSLGTITVNSTFTAATAA